MITNMILCKTCLVFYTGGDSSGWNLGSNVFCKFRTNCSILKPISQTLICFLNNWNFMKTHRKIIFRNPPRSPLCVNQSICWDASQRHCLVQVFLHQTVSLLLWTEHGNIYKYGEQHLNIFLDFLKIGIF